MFYFNENAMPTDGGHTDLAPTAMQGPHGKSELVI